MAARRKKTLAKSTAVEKSVADAVAKLTAACSACDTAVTSRDKDNKKNIALVKRLAKRKTSLAKRKKSAAARAKKAPSADTRGALRQVTRDLDRTNKELTKARTQKSTNADELKSLKTQQKRAAGYLKAITGVDKQLNKPPRRKKKATRR